MKNLLPNCLSRPSSFAYPIFWLSGVGIAGAVAVGMSSTASQMTDAQDTTQSTLVDAFDREVSRCGLELNANTVDFGTVFEGTKNTLAVTLTNTSDHEIQIASASASCGCTSVLTETPFQMPPGEERELVIQLNTNNNVGSLEKLVSVFVHEGQSRFKFPISVRANSIPLVTIDRRQVDFGMLKADDLAEADLTISLSHQVETSSTSPPVYIAAIPDGVKAELKEIEASNGSEREWNLKISVSGNEVPEESIDEDLIVVTPSTVEGVVRIPVRAMQHSYLSFEPGRVTFGVIRDQSDSIRTIQLECLEGHQYRITSVDIVDGPPFLTAKFDREQQQVLATVDPANAVRGFFKARILIRFSCDDGERQTLSIPVTGYRLDQS